MSVIPEDQMRVHENLFNYIYQNDVEAVRVSMELVQMLHVWDDLIDKDVEISNQEINAAFVAALCEVSGSWLWDANAAALARVAFLKWQTANYFEANTADENQKLMSFVFRAGFIDLFYYFAYKMYGMEWVQHVGPAIASWYGEDFAKYQQEFWG